MQLIDLLNRSQPPKPWDEGDNIPWHEPGFSERMLSEHLSQDHDAASRREKRIDQHVHWIHNSLLSANAASILDLGCGPGLYCSRLARLGHTCTGIDYSPASIRYARQTAENEQLACQYQLQDLREADYGSGHDLVMLIFGEFNIFRPAHARAILGKAFASLKPGGLLLLEPHTYPYVEALGGQLPVWYASPGGLFSPRPHINLSECFWDAAKGAATVRHFILDLETSQLKRYAQSFQAYRMKDYEGLLRDVGYQYVQFFAGLTGGPVDTESDFLALTAQK